MAAVGEGSSVVSAMAQVTAEAQVQCLAGELPYAMGAAKKRKKNAEDGGGG